MSRRPSLVLATSNGTGMGHLARQLAVGLAAAPEARVTLFSLSVALPTATSAEIPGEYCPGPDRGWIPETAWPHYLSGRLETLVREVSADVVVFDGVAPYRGITLAKSRLPETAFVWFRRGMWQGGVNEGQLWKSSLFDEIIEPGDLAQEADEGPTTTRGDAIEVPPVSLVEVVDRPTRDEAAAFLGIDPSRTTLLLTLGTGRLGDVTSPGSAVVNTVLESTDWQICVATSSVAQSRVSSNQSDRVIELKGIFPLARYLRAFDAVVSAAGYNAVHEYLPAGLPTLLVPNRLTRTDNQVGRADFLARRGLALAPRDGSAEAVEESVVRLVDDSTRGRLRQALADLPDEKKTGGARKTAAVLTRLANTFEPTPASAGLRLLRARDEAKEALKRRLGPEGTNRVRRLLGRPPIASFGRLQVAIDTDPPREGVHRLTFSSDPSVSQLLGDEVVEHVLPGASDGYVSAREILVDRHYEVVSSS